MKIKAIKIVSILFLTASAVIGQLFDFKSSAGSISFWGLAAIVIALLLGMFAIIVEYLEFKEQKKQNEILEQNEKNRIKSLAKLQLDINNSNNPLIPFKASFTTKLTTTDSIVKEISEYETTDVEKIIKTKYLKLVGTVKMGDNPYNFEEERPKEISCTTNDIEFINQLLESKKIRRPIVEIEIIPENSTKSLTFVYPTSEYNELINKVNELRLYDTTLYQDFRIPKWTMKSSVGAVFGVQNLLRAKIIVKAEYNKYSIPPDNVLPNFTNIILYFGVNPVHILSFTQEQLIEKQSSYIQDEKDSDIKFGNDLAKDFFQKHIKIFEIEVTDEIFNNQIRVYS